MARFYGYCRTSTDRQFNKKYSIEFQDNLLSRRAEELKLEYIPIYESGSGSSMEGRPKFIQLLDALKPGDVVGIIDASRATRNTADAIEFSRRIKDRGARLFVNNQYVDIDSPQGKLIWEIEAAMNSFQREVQNQKSRDGIAQKKLDAQWIPNNDMFGYRIVRMKPARNSYMEIEEPEAKVIRYAVQQFLEGESLFNLSKTISATTPYKMTYTALLYKMHNPIYAGYYNKSSFPNPYKKESFFRNPWDVIEADLIKSEKIPPIISIEDYKAMHTKELGYVEAGLRPNRGRMHHDYFLSGLVKCGTCGITASHIIKDGKNPYPAYSLKPHHKDCPELDRCLNYLIVEPMVASCVLWVFNHGFITEQYVKDRDERILQEKSDLNLAIANAETERTNLEEQNRRLTEFIIKHPDVDDDDIASRKKVLKLKADELGRSITKLKQQLAEGLRESDEIRKAFNDRKVVDTMIYGDEPDRNRLLREVLETIQVYSDRLVVRFRNAVNFTVKLPQRNHHWPETIWVDVDFGGQPQGSYELDWMGREVLKAYEEYRLADGQQGFDDASWAGLLPYFRGSSEPFLWDDNRLYPEGTKPAIHPVHGIWCLKFPDGHYGPITEQLKPLT